jgi:hypothetical protein
MVQWCKCFPHMSKILTLSYNMASNVIIQNNIILNIINIKVVMCIILVLQKRPDGLNHIWWVPPVEQELGLSFQRIWVHIQFQVGFVLDMSSNYFVYGWNSMLWWKLWLPCHYCFVGSSCFICVICIYLCILVSNTISIFFSSIVPHICINCGCIISAFDPFLKSPLSDTQSKDEYEKISKSLSSQKAKGLKHEW